MCYRGGYRTQNYCVENANGCIRLHDTRPSLCCPFFFFFFFLNCSDVCKLWHRWKEQEDQMFVSAVWARRHVNICDMKWAVSVVRPWKRDSWAALYFYFTFFFFFHVILNTSWTHSPSGLSPVCCCTAVCRDNSFLAVFTVCDCS